jgi:putative alpha-1,2-mannosidase
MSESKSPLETSRRSFLKSTGIAAAASMAPVATQLEAHAPTVTQHASMKDEQVASPVTLVSILQGTDSTPYFSRGNTLPIAARPFGMAHWTLQTTPNTPWMFQPGQRRIQGFRSTHQLSPWLGDYGQATFLPICGTPNLDQGARATSYRPEDSLLSPHTIAMRLLRYGICEGTTRCDRDRSRRCAVAAPMRLRSRCTSGTCSIPVLLRCVECLWASRRVRVAGCDLPAQRR